MVRWEAVCTAGRHGKRGAFMCMYIYVCVCGVRVRGGGGVVVVVVKFSR